MKLMIVLLGLASTALAGLDGARGLDGAGTRPAFPGVTHVAPPAPVAASDGRARSAAVEARRREIAAALEGWKRQLAKVEKEYRDSVEKWRAGKQNNRISSGSAKDSAENRRRQQEITRLRELIVHWSDQYAAM